MTTSGITMGTATGGWLGGTRSAARRDHRLQTPDTFVHTVLPELRGGEVVVHAAPAGGAAFAQYTAEMRDGAVLHGAGWERFCYVLEGEAELAAEAETRALGKGGFALVPEGMTHEIRSREAARVAVVERRRMPLTGDGGRRRVLVGREEDVAATPLMGDEAVEVRMLVPAAEEFDFAVNVMTYQPGASLRQVEIHVMEHGLLMLEGAGVYRLGDCWYPVAAGDFIWMGPFCPQWFGALGRVPARYLIYKDANRHPLTGEVRR